MLKRKLFDLPLFTGDLKPEPPHSLARIRQFLGYYDHIERTEHIRCIICAEGKAYMAGPKFAFVKGDQLTVSFGKIKLRRKGNIDRMVFIDENGETLKQIYFKYDMLKGEFLAPSYYVNP